MTNTQPPRQMVEEWAPEDSRWAAPDVSVGQSAWAYSLERSSPEENKPSGGEGTVPFIEVRFRRLLLALLLPSPSRDVESRDY